MLENERIIVDRGGIDPGIAALMQNANKGFDPAALMAMMNNGNGMFGGNGGWWWIFIIVLFWMWGGWGGNGFGRGNQAETNSDFARLAAMGNQNNNTDLLMQAINGNKDAINTFSTIGLTIATDKTQIVDMVKQSYNDCKVKKESVLKYDEEMRRCEDILKLLNTTPDITTNVTKDFKELDELKAEVKELKQLLQNVTTVRPEVKIETPSSEEKQIEI